MIDTTAMNAVAVSSTTTYYSSYFGGGDTANWSLHLEWTGTPTGTVTLWKSNKPSPSPDDDADWVQDTAITFTSPAGSASKGGYEVGNSGFKFYRLKYVNASGSGTLSLWVHAKGGY
jgi:hypothetical protein